MAESRYSPKVTVILVNYNGKKFLGDCIRSIKEQTYDNVSILVVDNCSQDQSVPFLRKEFPEIKVIVCKNNTGFAKGNNIGITSALKQGADYVLLLNVDTVIDARLIERLMSEADASTVTVPKIYGNKAMTALWYGGGGMDYTKGRSYHRIPKPKEDTMCEVEFACGCCMLVPADALKKTGLFDETFYLYFEDTDLSVRFQEKGIKIKYIPEAKLWHKIGGGRGKKGKYTASYYMTRNQLYFIKKYQHKIKMKTYQKMLDFIIKDILQEPDRQKRKYIWWGIQDFIQNNMGPLKRL